MRYPNPSYGWGFFIGQPLTKQTKHESIRLGSDIVLMQKKKPLRTTTATMNDSMTSARWFPSLSLLCAVFASLILIPGLGGYFIFDDGPNIVHNPAVHVTELDIESLQRAAYSFQAGGGSRALPMLTFSLDHWRAGLDPAAFKTTNLIIHTLTTLALAWLFRTLLLLCKWPPRQASFAALAFAMAWAMHPLQASSVLYVVQRMQTLATLFLVLALLAYLKARQAQMEDLPSRKGWILTILFGFLAFASKEDSIVLPAYMLALELTVLRFEAAKPEVARRLRNTWLLLSAIGVVFYIFIAAPHFWQWDAYPGRDYSTTERLMTQGRVLAMYLGQILLPLPENMPFYYDWIRPSRSLFQPWTTLPALMLIMGLLALAWHLRLRRPLFSLGVLLFFMGHFVSSNVIGLELAFEHRNHFPLIGAVLAIGDMIAYGMERLKLRSRTIAAICILLLIPLAGATLIRASLWGNPMLLAERSTEFAPGSARAWNSLCLLNYDLSEKKPDSAYLDKAIEICTQGGKQQTYSLTPLTNLIVFKTIRGDVTQADWDWLHDRLRHATMTAENSSVIWVVVNNAREEAPLDEDGVLEVIDIAARRIKLKPVEQAALGYYILGKTKQPDKAYRYFELAIRNSPPHSSFTAELLADLKAQGKEEWVKQLEKSIRQANQSTNSQ